MSNTLDSISPDMNEREVGKSTALEIAELDYIEVRRLRALTDREDSDVEMKINVVINKKKKEIKQREREEEEIRKKIEEKIEKEEETKKKETNGKQKVDDKVKKAIGKKIRQEQAKEDFRVPQHERNLIGLAFSGGGIRSATFGLGVLQGLADLGLLKFVDYLSTVSGGGYIGSWFAAWVKREGELENVVKQLKPSREQQAEADRIGGKKLSEEEPEAIYHLREFSNYLSPRVSFFSADSWTLIAIYLRNLLANQLVLLPTVLALMLLVRCVTGAFGDWSETPEWLGNLLGGLATVLMLISFFLVARSLNLLAEKKPSKLDVLGSGGTWFWLALACTCTTSVLMAWVLLPNTVALSDPLNVAQAKEWLSRIPGWKELTGRSLTRLSVFDTTDLWAFALVFAGIQGLVGQARVWSRKQLSQLLWDAMFAAIFVAVWLYGRINWQWNLFNWRLGGEAVLLAYLGAIFRFWVMWLWRVGEETNQKELWDRYWPTVCGLLSGGLQGSLLYLLLNQILWKHATDTAFVTVWGPPLTLLTFAVSGFVGTALLGRVAEEQEREWSARFNAWLLIVAVGWTVLFAGAIYGTLWFFQFSAIVQASLATGWVSLALTGLSLAKSSRTDGKQRSTLTDIVSLVAPYVFLIGLLCAMSLLTSRLMAAHRDDAYPDITKRIAATIPPNDIPPKGEQVTEFTRRTTQTGAPKPKVKDETIEQSNWVRKSNQAQIREAEYRFDLKHPNWEWLGFWLVANIAVAALFSWRVDINEFSLNAMYGNRLTRCYLGASRPKKEEHRLGVPGNSKGDERNPHVVTGFDPGDDLPLSKLRIGDLLDTKMPNEQRYWGPFPLINTALNLVSGDQLAWQERKAESFLLSPLYCGAKSLGYCDTSKYSADSLTLGKAVAISGAAANPNMGYHSAPATAALMTLFNVRLGWWLPNPKREMKLWSVRGPWFLLRWLANELFSRTDDKQEYVNVSDGGHFENLGVYELIRRRCRLIIVSDAGADPKFEFQDLGGMIRKCRTDFGVDIEINTTPIQRPTGSRTSKWNCVVGTIRYDHVEPTAPVGLLVYIKPSLTGREPADVQQYAEEHADFPHQPTLDQFFSESQFESYRALGYHCANETFRDAVSKIKKKTLEAKVTADASKPDVWLKRVNDAHGNFTENLVYRIRKKWLIPPEHNERFLASVEGFVKLHRDLRDDPRLSQLTQEMYPEPEFLSEQVQHGKLAAYVQRTLTSAMAERVEAKAEFRLKEGAAISGGKPRREEIHTACQMLQVMENAWLGMQLEQYHSHPINAGWMNLFHRWSNTTLLRRYWPLLRGEFSREFVDFCERESALKVDLEDDALKLVLFDTSDQFLQQHIFDEHQREWPKETQPDEGKPSRGLQQLIGEAWRLPPDCVPKEAGHRAFWFFSVKLKVGLPDTDPLKQGFVGGVIGLRKLDNDQIPKDESEKNCYELVVWVRPGFRQQGIGQTMVQSFFKRIWNDDSELHDLGLKLKGNTSAKLVVYFPKSGWTSSGDKLGKAQWLSYFAFYGFRRPGSDWPYSKSHEVLVCDVE